MYIGHQAAYELQKIDETQFLHFKKEFRGVRMLKNYKFNKMENAMQNLKPL